MTNPLVKENIIHKRKNNEDNQYLTKFGRELVALF